MGGKGVRFGIIVQITCESKETARLSAHGKQWVLALYF